MMSSYNLTAHTDHQFATSFDKMHHYQNTLQNHKVNFSVSHLLDLEELPNENCVMFTDTDQDHQVSLVRGQQMTSVNGNRVDDHQDQNSNGKSNHFYFSFLTFQELGANSKNMKDVAFTQFICLDMHDLDVWFYTCKTCCIRSFFIFLNIKTLFYGIF